MWNANSIQNRVALFAVQSTYQHRVCIPLFLHSIRCSRALKSDVLYGTAVSYDINVRQQKATNTTQVPHNIGDFVLPHGWTTSLKNKGIQT
jgi:hypothetical protein